MGRSYVLVGFGDRYAGYWLLDVRLCAPFWIVTRAIVHATQGRSHHHYHQTVRRDLSWSQFPSNVWRTTNPQGRGTHSLLEAALEPYLPEPPLPVEVAFALVSVRPMLSVCSVRAKLPSSMQKQVNTTGNLTVEAHRSRRVAAGHASSCHVQDFYFCIIFLLRCLFHLWMILDGPSTRRLLATLHAPGNEHNGGPNRNKQQYRNQRELLHGMENKVERAGRELSEKPDNCWQKQQQQRLQLCFHRWKTERQFRSQS
mmetsp:Transcript_80454/g.236654  ORF Transcript_80454/g.236654 Transcript_80454/m.236654 type:complete len:256 (+) Transcript_80454:543-1310(+)